MVGCGGRLVTVAIRVENSLKGQDEVSLQPGEMNRDGIVFLPQLPDLFKGSFVPCSRSGQGKMSHAPTYMLRRLFFGFHDAIDDHKDRPQRLPERHESVT